MLHKCDFYYLQMYDFGFHFFNWLIPHKTDSFLFLLHVQVSVSQGTILKVCNQGSLF